MLYLALALIPKYPAQVRCSLVIKIIAKLQHRISHAEIEVRHQLMVCLYSTVSNPPSVDHGASPQSAATSTRVATSVILNSLDI